jgi:preprotein translocase subunit Sec61beta
MKLEKIKEMCKENPKAAVIVGILVILFLAAAFQ